MRSFAKKGPDPFIRLAAGLGLALVLAVVVAAAGIRLGGFAWLRPVHRVAASLEVLVVLWLGWMAWRARAHRPAVLIALVLTVTLSAIGIAAGQEPPPAAAAANLLGGLALAAAFAWILGRESASARDRLERALLWILALLLPVQLVLGARLSIVERVAPAVPAHGLVAIALAALLSWVALARVRGGAGKLLFVLALAAPLAGFSALHYEYSALAALAHAAAAALLLASVAYALGRIA